MNRKFVIITLFLLTFIIPIIWRNRVPNDGSILRTVTAVPTDVSTSTPTATPSITATLSSWDFIEHTTPEATNTPHPNPYFPIIKTKIGLNGHAGTVEVDPQTGIVYAADEFDQLLRIEEGIPQFQDELTVPIALSEIAVDQDHNRVYALSDRYLGEIVEGTTVIENNEKVGDVPFPGRVLDMVFEPTRGWLYVYGYPSREKFEELNIDPTGVGTLQIIDGTEIVHEINPWEIRAFDAVVDSVNGHVYFSTIDYDTDRNDGYGGKYGIVYVYDGTEKLKQYEQMTTRVYSMMFHPKYETIHAFTSQFPRFFDHSMTTFQNGELINRQQTEGVSGAVINGVIHPKTDEMYILSRSTMNVVVVVMTNELIPQYKTSIPIKGTDVGFEEIVSDPFSGNVYLTNAYDGTLTIINGYEVIGVLDLDIQTVEMAVNPNNGDLYVSGGRSGNIWILGFEEGHVFPTE